MFLALGTIHIQRYVIVPVDKKGIDCTEFCLSSKCKGIENNNFCNKNFKLYNKSWFRCGCGQGSACNSMCSMGCRLDLCSCRKDTKIGDNAGKKHNLVEVATLLT